MSKQNLIKLSGKHDPVLIPEKRGSEDTNLTLHPPLPSHL